MKQFISMITAMMIIFAAGLFFTGCGHEESDPTPPTPSTVAVTGVSLSSSTMTLTVGSKGTLTFTISPSNATNKNVLWKSDNGDIATVDVNGNVTAVKAGTVNISVITLDGAKTATCVVTVTPNNVAVTGVSLDEESKAITLEKGQSTTLKYAIQPDDASDKSVTFKSSDENVATVSAEGVVKAVGEGTATVTVSTKDGGKTVTSEITVVPATIAVTGITMDDDCKEVTLEVGETAILEVTIIPEEATDKTVEWTSSDETVASVDATGMVTALKPGETTITATTSNGSKTATSKITVKDGISVTGITLNKPTLEIPAGESYTFEPEFFPKNATNRGVSWTSSKNEVATIAADGTMTAIMIGKTIITATTDDGGKQAICYVTVTAALTDVSGVDVSPSSITLLVGDTFALEANVKPSTAENKTVKWESTNDSVVSVDEDGTITAKKAGTATITCTTEEGKFTSKCSVKVENPGDFTIYRDGSEVPPQITYTLGSVTRDYLQFSLYDKVNKQLVTGSEVYGNDLKITSSNTSVANAIASNENYRVVKAYYQGTTLLSFSYKGKIIKSVQLTVKPKPSYTVWYDGSEVTEGQTLSINKGNSIILMPYEKVTGQTIYTPTPSLFDISSTDENVVKTEIAYLGASSSPTGIFNAWKLTALKAGTATVTIKYSSSLKRTIKVTVSDYEIRYNDNKVGSEITYTMGSAIQNYVKFYLYDNTTNKNINASNLKVTSSNNAVAEPRSYGEYHFNVEAMKSGTATLTFKHKDGTWIADVKLTVK